MSEDRYEGNRRPSNRRREDVDERRHREYGREAFRGEGSRERDYGGVGNESWERGNGPERYQSTFRSSRPPEREPERGRERDYEEERWRAQNGIGEHGGQWARRRDPEENQQFRSNQHGRWAGEQNQGWGQHDEREWRRAQEEGRRGELRSQQGGPYREDRGSRERYESQHGRDPSRDHYRDDSRRPDRDYRSSGPSQYGGWPQERRRQEGGWEQDDRGHDYERFESRRPPERNRDTYERGLGEGGWGREGERWTERQGGGAYQGGWNTNRGEEFEESREREHRRRRDEEAHYNDPYYIGREGQPSYPHSETNWERQRPYAREAGRFGDMREHIDRFHQGPIKRSSREEESGYARENRDRDPDRPRSLRQSEHVETSSERKERKKKKHDD